MKKMTTGQALKEAIRVYRANWADLLRAEGMTLAIWGICLAPLLFLTRKDAAPLALLTPVLLILLALPMRQSIAEQMQARLNGLPMATALLLPTQRYGQKVLRGLRMTGLLLLWSLPLAALVALFLWAWDGVDAITLLGMIGDPIETLALFLAALLVALLLIALGFAFHSGTRHAQALGDRKLLHGEHGRMIGLWLAGLVTALPLLVCLGVYMTQAALTAKTLLMEFLETLVKPDLARLLPSPAMSGALILCAALLLVLGPVRSLIPAVYLRSLKGEDDASPAA